MEFTGERVVEGATPERIWQDHRQRYVFAESFVSRKTVLDISCGSGYGAFMMAKAGALRVVGLDISEETVKYARQRYQANNLEFQPGDVASISFDTNRFDLAVCFETIEHVPDHEKALKELWRVLKPGGKLLVSSPNRLLTSPFYSKKGKLNNPFHANEFTPKEFTEIVEKHFKIEGVFGQRGVPRMLMFANRVWFGKKIFFRFYKSEMGQSVLEPAKENYEYRYLTLVCEK